MLPSPLLIMKEQVQQRLDKAGGHDLRQYAMNLHRIVKETEQQYHIKFHYVLPENPDHLTENQSV